MQVETLVERFQRVGRLAVWVRHVLAVLLVLLFFGIRYLLDEQLRGYPFLLFFPPLILTSLLLNRGTGFTALAASTMLAWFFFIEPVGSMSRPAGNETLALAIFVAVGAFTVSLIEGLRIAGSQLTRTKKSLSDQVTLLNGITEGVPDPIFVKTRDGFFVHANSALASILGVERASLIGHHDREFLKPHELAAIENIDREVMATGEVRVVEERVTPAGHIHPRTYLSTKAPWRDANGEIVGVIAIVRDIDARKALEEQLRATSELNRILLFDINHRLKNQLQAVSAMLSMAARDIHEPKAHAALAAAARRLTVLARVNDRLHLDEGATRVRAIDFIEPLCDDLRSGLIEGRPIALRTLIDTQIALDPQRAVSVGLIINELVANALKYAFPDERPGAVSIQLRRVNTDFCLEIADNGVGFDYTNMKQGSGTRLVQLLAQQLAADLGWKRDSGTRVQLCFPVKDGETLVAQ